MKNKGISLIVLIITCVVIIIIATAIIVNIAQTNLIGSANEAVVKQDFKTMQDELIMYKANKYVESQGKFKAEDLDITDKAKIAEIIPSIVGTKYEEYVVIEDGKIAISDDMPEKERKWAMEALGLIKTSSNRPTQTEKPVEPEKPEEPELSEFEKLQNAYVQDGLTIWYDGVYNTLNGHDNSATSWKNLVSESTEFDGILKNITNTSTSGWTSKSLILDGVDDWVNMGYLYSENITVEIVAKPLDVKHDKEYMYICNADEGGVGIGKATNRTQNKTWMYIDGEYKYVFSDDDIKNNQIYSMSLAYDGSYSYFSENGKMYINEQTGKIADPKYSTVFALGTNPSGENSKPGVNGVLANIEIYSVRIYNRSLSQEEINKNYESDVSRFNITNIEQNKDFGYVSDGLICLYDGEMNTYYGHSKSTNVWWDLTGNGNHGVLKNVNKTNSSGWTSKSLILDGVDDWVKMTYMHFSNMTVEIVAKPITMSDKSTFYISNVESGGVGILKSAGDNRNRIQPYVGGEYKYIYSENIASAGKIYSMSFGCNGSSIYFGENGTIYEEKQSGTYGEPANSTVFALATNPSGENSAPGTGGVLFNEEVYSVRIYNRCLSREEILKNYEIDKARFGI